MTKIKKKILITGGNSRFCYFLKKNFNNKNEINSDKKKLNILDYPKLIKVLRKNKIKVLIHVAALSRPMQIHEKKIENSIGFQKPKDY